MNLLIVELENRIKSGFVNYSSLIEILKIIEEMLDESNHKLSTIEKKILVKMFKDILDNKEHDLDHSRSNDAWSYFRKTNSSSLEDSNYEVLVGKIKTTCSEKKYDSSNLIYLLLCFKKSFNQVRSYTRIGARDLIDIYEYLEYLNSNIDMKLEIPGKSSTLKKLFSTKKSVASNQIIWYK